MSKIKEFILSAQQRHLDNIDYFESMYKDIEKERENTNSELIKSGLLLLKEETCKHINKNRIDIALYDKLMSDNNFKISDIDYLIGINDFSETNINIIIDACLNYYRFLEFNIKENHYEREIKQIKNNFQEMIKIIDNDSYLLQPTLTIPLSPTMIRKELLDNLIYSKYNSETYSLLLESLPLEGQRKPRKYNSPPLKKDGKDITGIHKNSKEHIIINKGKIMKYSIIEVNYTE